MVGLLQFLKVFLLSVESLLLEQVVGDFSFKVELVFLCFNDKYFSHFFL